MIKKEFSELLKRLKTERLLSSEAEDLFRVAKGNRYCLKLNFIQFSSVLGRQLDSNYNSGYKFECITEEELDVLVLFQDEHKELVGSLSGQNSREINVQVLGYDSLYQKPILGYLEGEINQQQLEVEDDGEGEAKGKSEADAEAEGGVEVEAKTRVKALLKSGPNHREEDPEKVEAELKEGGGWESKRPINESVEDEKSGLDLHTKITIFLIISAVIIGNIIGFYFVGAEIALQVTAISVLGCGLAILGIIKGWGSGGKKRTLVETLEQAEAGDAEAQLQLGERYIAGNGVPQDWAEAVKWYNLAAATGLENATKSRDILAKLITKEQIAEGQKLTREWLERKAKEKGQ